MFSCVRGGCFSRREGGRELSREDFEDLSEYHDPAKSNYVPPERWGIDREDLKFFGSEVKRLYDEQKIPKSTYCEPPHPGAKEPNWGHDDPRIGPSIYQVNEHYIKPVTKAHSGMSWALMRHNGGLDIDCFATHAWIEGVWEFIKKVGQSWPHECHSLYICFLANPQFGVKKMLTGGITNSPFYRALHHSKTMIVIPNHKVSIYTRKWCVYEAHLALQLAQNKQMNIVLPWVRAKRWVFLEILPALMFGVAGYFIGDKVLCHSIGVLLGPVMWLLFSFFSSHVLGWALRGYLSWWTKAEEDDPHDPNHQVLEARRVKRLYWATQSFIIFQYLEIFGIFLCSGFAWSHFEAINEVAQGLRLNSTHGSDLHIKFNTVRTILWHSDIGMRFERGEGTSCLMVIIAFTVAVVYRIIFAMTMNIIKKSSGQLYFQSVRDARCADKDDEDNIDEAIEAQGVDIIDQDIKRLRSVGRYNQAIAKNLDLGMSPDIAAEGINPCKIACATVAWQFWWITDLAGWHHDWAAWAIPIASITILIAGAYSMGDFVIFAIDGFFWCGVLFLIATNHSLWFEHDAVKAKAMSRNTLGMQLICLFLVIPFCSYHYLGIRRAWHDCLRKHGWSWILAAGESPKWGDKHHIGDPYHDDGALDHTIPTTLHPNDMPDTKAVLNSSHTYEALYGANTGSVAVAPP